MELPTATSPLNVSEPPWLANQWGGLNMSNSGVSGLGNGHAHFAPHAARTEPAHAAPGADVAPVKQLLNQLFEATQTSSTQTAQHLRNQLNEHRQKLGDGSFKNVLNTLIETLNAYIQFQKFVSEFMKALFPDADNPAPTPPGQAGGGSPSHHVHRRPQPSRQNMSHKPLTLGAGYFDYKPDKSEPGKKPGTGNEAGNIWSGFQQGPDGNCVTVSAIKAAMMKFGQKPTDIFKDVRATGDGYTVQMRDGFQLHLNKGELKQAAEQARFKGDDAAMMTDANFLFAASAKRAQMENNDGYAGRNFAAALDSLNDGEDGQEGLMRLGLRDHIRHSSASALAAGQIGVVTHGITTPDGKFVGHSLAVINGREEVWGKRGGQPPGNAHAFALV
ncbi:hypothetical protein Q7C20_13810 [Pseudomonas sp. AMR01]